MNIAFSPPDIRQEDIDEVIAALKSGWITTGPRTKAFEEKLSEYCHTQKTACLSAATTALELTLRILGVGPGDEVIVPAYTYTASASVVAHVGAKLVLVDSTPNAFHVNPKAIEKAITRRTKAVIPVDIGGVMCDYDEIFEAVEAKRSLFKPGKNDLQKAIGRVAVIADGAHSLGAQYRGRMSGEVADFTTFSFHAVKNLTTAEGGAVTWKPTKGIDDETIYHQFMLWSLHGQSKDALAKTQKGAWEYDIIYPGYKCNMTDLQAALGLKQLERYDRIIKRRKEIIQKYNDAFKDLPVEVMPHDTKDKHSSAHLYLMRLKDKNSDYRNALITELAERGIVTNVHYKPLPMHTAYKNLGFDMKQYPWAYTMYKNEITLPLYTCLSDEEVDYIIKNIQEIMQREMQSEAIAS